MMSPDLRSNYSHNSAFHSIYGMVLAIGNTEMQQTHYVRRSSVNNYVEGFSFYLPTKLIYEVGAIKKKLSGEIKILNTNKVLVVTDPGVLKAGLLADVELTLKDNGIIYEVFSEVEANPSTDTCYKGYEIGKTMGAGALLTVGGGSAMDVAKAIAVLMTNGGDLTSYEGADKFRNYKMSIASTRILPKVALLDPTVLNTLPPQIAAACGMDALTHAVESYINRASSPVTDAFGVEAIRLIGKYLRPFVANRANMEAAAGMMVASTLAGIAFCIARLGNVHAMAHPLGGFFNVPHGVANAILLPHVMKFNMLADNGKYKRIAELLGEDVNRLTDMEAAPLAVQAILKLSAAIGIPKNLTDVGVKEDKIAQMSVDAMASGNVKINPRVTVLADIEALYRGAM